MFVLHTSLKPGGIIEPRITLKYAPLLPMERNRCRRRVKFAFRSQDDMSSTERISQQLCRGQHWQDIQAVTKNRLLQISDVKL